MSPAWAWRRLSTAMQVMICVPGKCSATQRSFCASAQFPRGQPVRMIGRSEEHTSELQSLMRISYAVFCLKKKKTMKKTSINYNRNTIRTEKHYSQLKTTK